MPAIESFLTREFEIRFIDARVLATEARLNLGIKGYVAKDQEQAVIDEAIRIFDEERREQERCSMQCRYVELKDVIRTTTESICGSSIGDDSLSDDGLGEENDVKIDSIDRSRPLGRFFKRTHSKNKL